MSFFNTLTNFFDKYGGRNGTASQGNYNSGSYGGSVGGSGYSSYQYGSGDITARNYVNPSVPDQRNYEVTGRTESDYRAGRTNRNNADMWDLPNGNGTVYKANYDAGMGFVEDKQVVKGGPLNQHNVRLNNGSGSNYTYHTYDPNYDGNYRKAQEAVGKEWQKVEGSSKGVAFSGYNIEDILNTNGITSDRLKNKLLNMNRININRAPSFTEMVNFGKQYIFFSKPDLNLFIDNAGTVNPSIVQNCPDLYMKIIRNPGAAKVLQASFNGINKGAGGLINILTNFCNTCDFPEIGLSKKEGPKNIKGQSVSYGGDFMEATDQSDINISFLDNRTRDVSTMMEIWTEYIEGVNNGTISKKSQYISNNTVDYAINIFIMSLDEVYNIISFGMAGACYPTTVSTDLLSYQSMPRTASELSGPFDFKFHVGYFHKPNQHRILEQFNIVTGFADQIKIPNTQGSHQYMYRNINGYWIHSGIIPYRTTLASGYEFHYNLEDKWAEMVGVNFNYPSDGSLTYTLVFASRNVGKARKPGTWGKLEHEFYKFDDDIQENVNNWETWKSQHPDYYKNPTNKDILGTPLWNQDRFNPDYNAWITANGGRTWNDRFNRGYTSNSGRYGQFTSGGSNSGFAQDAWGQVARAFSKIF